MQVAGAKAKAGDQHGPSGVEDDEDNQKGAMATILVTKIHCRLEPLLPIAFSPEKGDQPVGRPATDGKVGEGDRETKDISLIVIWIEGLCKATPKSTSLSSPHRWTIPPQWLRLR